MQYWKMFYLNVRINWRILNLLSTLKWKIKGSKFKFKVPGKFLSYQHFWKVIWLINFLICFFFFFILVLPPERFCVIPRRSNTWEIDDTLQSTIYCWAYKKVGCKFVRLVYLRFNRDLSEMGMRTWPLLVPKSVRKAELKLLVPRGLR